MKNNERNQEIEKIKRSNWEKFKQACILVHSSLSTLLVNVRKMLNICYNIYKERQQEQKKGRRVNIQAIKRTKKDNRMDDNRKIENFML